MNNEKAYITPPPPAKSNHSTSSSVQGGKPMNMPKKRFSLQKTLVIIFGCLITAALITEGSLAIWIASTAVTEKVEDHLTDKANDVADVIDARIEALFQFLESIARRPVIRDSSIPYAEKIALLKNEVEQNDILYEAGISDLNGTTYVLDGRTIATADRDWVKAGLQGKNFMTEPYLSRTDNQMIISFAVPIYNESHNLIGVLGAATLATWLTDQIKDIIVGKTGYCYIIGPTGTMAAHKNKNLVDTRSNILELAKTDESFISLAQFINTCLKAHDNMVGYYTYNGVLSVASFAEIGSTQWKVIITAPKEEFMGAIDSLQRTIGLVASSILIAAIITVLIVAHRIVKPIRHATLALKDIAQGEGDLTVRLPISGNSEIADMSEYFNETIEKIRLSIQAVGRSSTEMETVGTELAANMTETASAVHQISANIDGVKQQALTQAASVTETAATIEEIVRTIKQLNNSIETQAASVAQSSASVEQMVANIASISQTLSKTDETISNLTSSTNDGKATVVNSNAVTQKIAEESGSLLEASSVIQHIASQTNLLAMNAAIEAAHAGEAGKGFAVVADEIRKLAEDSAAQGKTITTTLKELSGEIEILSNSSKTVEAKFTAIFNLAAQVKEMSKQLTESMREQENGSKEVLQAIKNINMVTNEVQAGSAEMLKGGEGVAAEMRKLDNLTHIITNSMNEMASGAVQITNAVQEVNGITQKNKENIDNLAEEVGKFKV